MKKTIFTTSSLISLASMLLIGLNSCVNEDYDIDKLDTEITVASEGLVLPLGKTAPITVQDLLKELDQDMITSLENGTCAFRLGDSFPLSDNLPDMNSIINIPDVKFNNGFTIQIADFDADAFKLDEQAFSNSFGIDDSMLEFTFDNPQVNIQTTTPFEVYKYAEKAENLSLNSQNTDFEILMDMSSLFGTYPDGTSIPIELPPTEIGEMSKDISISMNPIEGVSDIKNIKLTSTSELTVGLSVANSFLTQGAFIPSITIDLGNLMTLEGCGSTVSLGAESEMSSASGFKSSKSYKVQSINLDPANWGENGFSQTNTIKLKGCIAISNSFTDAEKIRTFLASPNNGILRINVTIECDDIQIESFSMDIDSFDLPQTTQTIPFNISSIKLPEGVSSVNSIRLFDPANPVPNANLSISFDRLKEIAGMAVELETLELQFPEGLEVDGAVNGKITCPAQDITNGFTKDILIKSLSLPAPQNGQVSYSGDIRLTANAKAIGNDVLSTSIPTTAGNDVTLNAGVKSKLEVKDYSFTALARTIELKEEKYDFSYDVDASIAEYGTVSIYPEGEPAISIQLDIPSTALNIKAGTDKGITVIFPDFIHFGTVPSTVNYDRNANSINIKGECPGVINLPVDHLTLDPVRNGDKYCINGQVSVSGEVVCEAAELNKADVDALKNIKVGFTSTIPSMAAKDVSLVKFEKEIEESFDICILSAKDLPDGIVSISEVVLKDVQATLDLSFKNLPELNTDITVAAQISFPDVIKLDENDSRVKGSTLSIDGVIKDGKLNVAPVKIVNFDLASYDFSSGKDLTGSISVNGRFTALNPRANLKQLGGDIEIGINAGISDIEFEKISGKLDYDIQEFNETITLDGVPDFMKAENFKLDFANPHLLLKVKTNLGIPVDANLSLIPVFDGKDGSPVNCLASLPVSSSAAETVTTNFWLAGSSKGCPSDCTFIEADIRSLLLRIPDKFRLVLDAGVNSALEGVIEPESTYTLDVDYEFVAPLEFGNETNIETEQIIDGLDSEIGNLLRKNSLKIGGTITNTMPLELLLSVELVDNGNNVIPMDTACEQVIKACASDGSASVTDLDLVLHRNDIEAMSNLAGLKLKYKVTSPVAGVAVKEDSYLQATLNIALPEGYTIDLKQD